MFKCLEREVQNLKATGQWGEGGIFGGGVFTFYSWTTGSFGCNTY